MTPEMDLHVSYIIKRKANYKLLVVYIMTTPPHIALAINYIRERVTRMNNVNVIDLEIFIRNNYLCCGVHLKYKKEKKPAFIIFNFVKNFLTKTQVTCKDDK
ncbi:hypothetical protein J6590_033994 [Homalodisca vitripennis]|nr:hypothetical protein J6590_033994 [Homalodisca vitripennis]